MDAVERLDLLDTTRIIYTSDHGEAAGHHGILGKANHYEHSIGVPLLIQGAGITPGTRVAPVVSLVDLFPTIVESVGGTFADEDLSLPGKSLWDLATGTADPTDRIAFTEFHAMGSLTASFAIRKGSHKLIYHVDMPSQLFDLSVDPREENDLLAAAQNHPVADALIAELHKIVDPQAVEKQEKPDQRARIEELGGVEAVAKAGVFSVSPIPGKSVDLETTK